MAPSIEKLLFATASSLTDETERRVFLDYACREDPELREQIEELLEAQVEADTFFEFRPEVEPQLETEEPQSTEEEGMGARIGRYRLITRIGAGGCGVVYYAQQEEPVRRKVALKIVKMGMDTEAVIARFGMERQALAQMDHPNIARVLDAGATAAGRPYFVMELVEGEKLTDFCETNRLTIPQRLSLFVQVCHAVQHAHQKGIIHRDIKPSNILASWNSEDVAVPKVIDFGIAKATASIASQGSTATQMDQLLGTPDYMSPEQAQGGGNVDTRSDIYSLGVLLYELLCGRAPFALTLKEYAVDEIRRVIREQDPMPPSKAFRLMTSEQQGVIAANRGTAHLAAQLVDDLDWIVMKSMEKERSNRYPTASGLAADVLRYLNNEVVQASPPSRAYRLGKLVRRNKLVFISGGIAIFGLLTGFGTSTWMFFRERAARQEQTRLRENAENLRHESELRELVARAAVKVKYGDLAGAEKLLAQVPREQTPSSLEAAQAFSAVGEWHIHEGRMKEAAARMASAASALTSVDDSDLPRVSINVLPVPIVVAYVEGRERYDEIRKIVFARFGATTNPVVAEETLKACMMMPAERKMLQALQPLAKMVEQAIETRQGLIGTDNHHQAWACFCLSTFYYRSGDYLSAARWAERCLSNPNQNNARKACMLSVQAMIAFQTGQAEKARALAGQARGLVQEGLSDRSWWPRTRPLPSGGAIYWFDWINADLFASEAEQLAK